MTRDPMAELLAALPSVSDNLRLEYGIVTAVSGLTVTVNLSGSSVAMPFANSYPVNVGDTVAVVRIGMYALAVGATNRATPVIGTVTGTGSFTVTVTVNGTTGLVMRYLSSYSPTVGDSVWVADGGVLGKFASAPPAPSVPTAPLAPPGAAHGGTNVYPARDAASYRGGWRSDSNGIFQGSTSSGANAGAWFIGTGPQDQLVGATCTQALIWLHRIKGSGVFAGQAVHLYLHTSADRPGGDVSRISGPRDQTLAVDEYGWYDLGADWGQTLIAGTGRGFGIAGEPYLQLASIPADSQTGAVQLTWTR